MNFQHLKSVIGKNKVYFLNDSKIKANGFKNVSHIIENAQEGQIDTGKMMSALMLKVQKLGVLILNSIPVSSYIDHGNSVKIIVNKEFEFTSKKLLIATNGFAMKLLPNCAVDPARGQVIITSPIKKLNVKGAFHFQKGYYYFRNIGDRLLLGGGRNLNIKQEQTMEFGTTEIVQKSLEKLLKTTILPNAKYTIDQRWSGIMGMGLGLEKSPIVKTLSKNTFCALRMGGMGIAIGSLVGEEVAELIEQSW